MAWPRFWELRTTSYSAEIKYHETYLPSGAFGLPACVTRSISLRYFVFNSGGLVDGDDCSARIYNKTIMYFASRSESARKVDGLSSTLSTPPVHRGVSKCA